MCHVCLIVNRLLYGVNKFSLLRRVLTADTILQDLQKRRIFLAKVREGHKTEGLHGPKINFVHLSVFFFKTLSALGRKYL